MGNAIVSLDGKNGILKASDAGPMWTGSSILTYIGIFGYSAFVKEYKRIESAGGACVSFYYVHNISKNFILMLTTKQLGYQCFNNKKTGIHDYDYGYHVTENEITTYRYGKFVDTAAYSKEDVSRCIVTGIFSGSIADVLKEKYKLFNFASD